MTTRIVHDVRRELASDGTHLHITHLRTTAGELWPVSLVALSIRAGEAWLLANDDYVVSIRPTHGCPSSGCSHAPYLETTPNSVDADNLENSPEAPDESTR